MRNTSNFFSTIDEPEWEYWAEAYVKTIANARHNKPVSPTATVSSFREWVFHCQHVWHAERRSTTQVASDLADGRFLHEHVDQFWSWYRRIHSKGGRTKAWDLIYSDPHDGSAPPLTASQLRIGEACIVGKPDAVLRNTLTGEVIIIERKFTWYGRTHPRAWVDLRAQLWAYSHMDEWRDAPEIYLIAQIWARDHAIEGRELVPNIAPRWRKGHARFYEEMRRLFELYGGTVVAARHKAI